MNWRKFRIISLLSALISIHFLIAQSVHVAGVFPTIDHSGPINSKPDYSLYYFAAFPLVNFNKPDVPKDTCFHCLYAEHALSYKVSSKLVFTGSYDCWKENTV